MRPTALLIPSPWSGDERDPVPRSYRWWFWLHVRTRRLRHRVGLHDWKQVWPDGGDPFKHCTWCGLRR